MDVAKKLNEARAEVERLRAEINDVRNAARRQVEAWRAGSNQALADVRRIRSNLMATNLCDDCRVAVTVAFNDLGELLPVEAKPERKPCPEGFHYIGQSFASCDECGLPAWDHEGMAVLAKPMNSPFSEFKPVLRPWGDGERERIKRLWEKGQ